MLDARQYSAQCIYVPPGVGLLRLLVPGVAVGVFVDHCCVVDWGEFTRGFISPMGELFREDEQVEF